MNAAPVVKLDTGGDVYLDGERPAYVAPGRYDVVFEHWRTAKMFGKANKLILAFRIVSQGEYFETTVSKYYNVKGFVGEPGFRGKFRVGWSSDFVKEYAKLFGIPQRIDRLSMRAFQGNLIRAHVRTVDTDNRQKILRRDLRYSVIDHLIRIVKP